MSAVTSIPSDLLHISVCADLLDVPEYKMRGLVETDQILARKVDGRTFVALDELVRFARARRQAREDALAAPIDPLALGVLQMWCDGFGWSLADIAADVGADIDALTVEDGEILSVELGRRAGGSR